MNAIVKNGLYFIAGASLASYVWTELAAVSRNKKQVVAAKSDATGHYDLDGVSYDPCQSRVVVGSDAQVKAPKLPKKAKAVS